MDQIMIDAISSFVMGAMVAWERMYRAEKRVSGGRPVTARKTDLVLAWDWQSAIDLQKELEM